MSEAFKSVKDQMDAWAEKEDRLEEIRKAAPSYDVWVNDSVSFLLEKVDLFRERSNTQAQLYRDAAQERTELVKALQKYGNHKGECARYLYGEAHCDCGLDEIRQKFAKYRKQGGG